MCSQVDALPAPTHEEQRPARTPSDPPCPPGCDAVRAHRIHLDGRARSAPALAPLDARLVIDPNFVHNEDETASSSIADSLSSTALCIYRQVLFDRPTRSRDSRFDVGHLPLSPSVDAPRR
jgi:hypothetical protein